MKSFAVGALALFAAPYAASAQSPVALSKIVVGVETGAEVGKIRGGALCLTGPWRWRGIDTPPFEDEQLSQRFEKVMKALGYNVASQTTDLFNATTDSSPFLVAGRIDAIDLRLCYPSIGFGNLYKSKGQASVKVTWQIFSQVEKKVIATVATEGKFDRQRSITDGSYSVMLKALEGAIGQLVASPDFVKAFGQATTPVALPEPDPILPAGETDPKKALKAP